jgi:hypothetical protein
MPKWACRLWLEVEATRVERVQDITEADAIAEGVEGPSDTPVCVGDCRTAYGKFHDLWDSINSASGHGWDRNEWVWVVAYRHIEQEVS